MGRYKLDIKVGDVYGKLCVISENGSHKKRGCLWRCQCGCGREVIYGSSQLKSGKALTCNRCTFGYYAFDGDVAVCSLPNGIKFKIDKEDYSLVSKYKWGITTSGYICAVVNGKKTYLHYLLIPRKQGLQCDHINRDKMDNRRQNLRYATPSENLCNKSIQRNNTTGYIGVCLTPDKSRYRAYLSYQGIQRRVGVYETAEKAAQARDKIALQLFGEFAVLNFPLNGVCL